MLTCTNIEKTSFTPLERYKVFCISINTTKRNLRSPKYLSMYFTDGTLSISYYSRSDSFKKIHKAVSEHFYCSLFILKKMCELYYF